LRVTFEPGEGEGEEEEGEDNEPMVVVEVMLK